nr:hypothetical protein [Tanacetum cinerariifolium]
QAEQIVPLQAEQYDWLADTDEEVDEQELEAHYSYMDKIQEVPTADSGTDSEPVEQCKLFSRGNSSTQQWELFCTNSGKIILAMGTSFSSGNFFWQWKFVTDSGNILEHFIPNKVQNEAGYNVFANSLQHSEQSESVSNTCLVETNDSNVIPDSPDINQTTLAQELKECKAILAETSKSLGESISVRDSCLVALQTKQAEFEKYKAFNDRTIDYDKLERKLNEALGQLAQKDTAQSEIPCLYAFPYDQSTYSNRLIPDGEETLALERESRSKLNKDLVRPYDYTTLNSLYEIFKSPTQEYETQLAYANEIRRKMWQKSFVKSKPNIYKNIGFLPVSKSIGKSQQAYNVMTNNINHFKEIVDNDWIKHSKDQFRAPTPQDMEILIQTCLMPLAIKTQNDSFKFVHELKQEMHADLKYVKTLEKEIDEL